MTEADRKWAAEKIALRQQKATVKEGTMTEEHETLTLERLLSRLKDLAEHDQAKATLLIDWRLHFETGEKGISLADLAREAAASLSAHREALRPFARYYEHARKHEWPAAIADSDSTPIMGSANFDTGENSEVCVGDFRRAAKLMEE